MKKIIVFALALAMAVSCAKDDNEQLKPVDQKEHLKEVSMKVADVLDDPQFKKASELADYYRDNLASLNDSQVRSKVGNVMSVTDGFFNSVPETKSGFNWNWNGTNACFEADMVNHRWEYAGEGDRSGVSFIFKDDEGNDCSLVAQIQDKNAYVILEVNGKKVADCNVGYVYNGIGSREAFVKLSAGPVVSNTLFSMDKGRYVTEESVLYNGRNVANCIVTADNTITLEDGLISGFGKFNVDVNVMDELYVDVNCGTSFNDIVHGIDFSKDYVERLEDNLNRYVDAKVYFDHKGEVQSEIRFSVDKKGILGPVTVAPYIYFTNDGTSCEFDEYFQFGSILPELIAAIEDLFGGWIVAL